MQRLVSDRAEVISSKRWFVLTDDDTWLNVPALAALIRRCGTADSPARVGMQRV